jgi:hypothetical protein
LERERISALGAAATLTEHYALKQLELNAALADSKITQDTYNRALGAAGTDLANNLLTARISLLGYEGVVVFVFENTQTMDIKDSDGYEHCTAAETSMPADSYGRRSLRRERRGQGVRDQDKAYSKLARNRDRARGCHCDDFDCVISFAGVSVVR